MVSNITLDTYNTMLFAVKQRKILIILLFWTLYYNILYSDNEEK